MQKLITIKRYSHNSAAPALFAKAIFLRVPLAQIKYINSGIDEFFFPMTVFNIAKNVFH